MAAKKTKTGKAAFGQLLQAEVEFLVAFGWKPEPAAPGSSPIWWTSPHDDASFWWADAVWDQRLRCNTLFDDDCGEMERVACVIGGCPLD